MTDQASDRNPTSGLDASEALDRKVVGGFSFEQCAYVVLALVALVSRLYEAGIRPLHHDESIHAVFSWKIVTEGVGSYMYDPVYHGPVLYYWTALMFRLFGDSDFVARLSPILFGFAFLGLAWPLRRFIGRWGALLFFALVTISPSWIYYTRFLRHDIYVAFCNLACVVLGFRYGQTRTPKFLYGSVAALALSFCTKEDLYALLPVMLVSLVFVFAWEIVYARNRAQAFAEVRGEVASFLRGAWLPILSSLILFALIWLVFYTSFFSHPEKWNAVSGALSYWLGQHEIQRIGGPWWYYFPHLFFYEALIFIPAILFAFTPMLRPRPHEPQSTLYLVYAAWLAFGAFAVSLVAFPPQSPYVLLVALTLAGFVHMLRWLPDRFTRFAIIWSLGSIVFYAWAQEKVPWLLVPILTPMVLLSALWFRARVEDGSLGRPQFALLVGALLVLTGWTSIASNYYYDAPRPNEAKDQRTGELLAYVQSTYDIHDKVMSRIDATAATLGTGTATRLAISGEATWPMSWYVRHYPVNWGAGLRKIDTPIVIADIDAANALREPLKATYDEIRFQIRGWWEPSWKDMNLTNLAKWIATRQAFSGVGSSDAVMFALKDVQPGMTIAAIDVNPPPPPRGYPGQPQEVQPAAVWGHQGAAKGEFNEPRGLALDSRGNLYVADSKNHRIQKLGPDGTPLLEWGRQGAGDGEFNDPCGITVAADGTVYVADTWNHRIQKFDSNGVFQLQMQAPGGMWGPRGIAVSPDGNSIYITDTGNKRVVRFDPQGNQVGVWGKEGSKEGEFIEPVGIAVNAQGEVIVADTGNRRLQVFDPAGTFVRAFPVSGWEEFYSEPYLAVLGADVLVTDSYNHRAARYTGDKVALSWGKSGEDKGEFNRPIGIATDNQGGVYVADTLNHRIQKFFLP